MITNVTENSINELIGISDDILIKTQQMKQEFNSINYQNQNLSQFFSDLLFGIQKINNSLKFLRTSSINLSYNLSNEIEKNNDLKEQIKKIQNENFYLETNIINVNHTIQDLNSIIREKDNFIQELNNSKNNICICNSRCPCCKDGNNNNNLILQISDYKTKKNNNNIYSNNIGSLAYDYNDYSNVQKYNHKNNFSYDSRIKKNYNYSNNDMVNKTTNVLNSYVNHLNNFYSTNYSNFITENNDKDYSLNNNKIITRNYYIPTNQSLNNNSLNEKKYISSNQTNSSVLKNNSTSNLNYKINVPFDKNNEVLYKNNNDLNNYKKINPEIKINDNEKKRKNKSIPKISTQANYDYSNENKYNLNYKEAKIEYMKTAPNDYHKNNTKNEENSLHQTYNLSFSGLNSNNNTINELENSENIIDSNKNLINEQKKKKNEFNNDIKINKNGNKQKENKIFNTKYTKLKKGKSNSINIKDNLERNINKNNNKNIKEFQEEEGNDKKNLMKNKVDRVQNIVQQIFKDNNTINKLKQKLGNNFIEKITSGDVTEEYLNKIESNLKEIKELNSNNNSLNNNDSKIYKSSNSFFPKKKYKDPVLNNLYNKQKLKKEITDNQYHYKEKPRGWISSKEYFTNNKFKKERIEKSPLKITNQPKKI
jgi:hypothetical protein